MISKQLLDEKNKNTVKGPALGLRVCKTTGFCYLGSWLISSKLSSSRMYFSCTAATVDSYVKQNQTKCNNIS